MRREWLLSFGAVVLALLSTQHHNLMMLFLALGLGDAGMSVMTDVPLVRTAMLVLSLLMVGPIGYQISRPGRPPAMEKPFKRDLSHLSWDQVYARQARRAGLISDWMEALRLKSGHRVLEIGAGPGYVSFALADRVGPAGVVYALDRSADALAYLGRLQEERGVAQIQRITADAAMLERTDVPADSALITMVLHHADDPAGILHNVARFVPPGAPVVIGEFHPEGPCEDGPPREHRLAPEKIQSWCEHAGLSVVGYRRQTPEHYVVVAQHGLRSGPEAQVAGRCRPDI